MNIKSITIKLLKKLPGIRRIVRKIGMLEKELEDAEYQNLLIARTMIDYRLKLKKIKNEKINVVFVCHRPSVWESLHSVYDAIKEDRSFDVKIVAIPNKKQLPKLGLNHEIYESEGAEEFWNEYGCINGFDYNTGEWFDLKSLKPDYIFFQQPYNITRCEEYKSWNVAKYAKICYLNYFSPCSFGKVYEECSPVDFLKDISFYFTQHPKDHEFIVNRYKKIGSDFTKCIMTGYPRYDYLNKVKKSSDIWSDHNHRRYRIVWTPRWTTNERNCHFFKFKDKLIQFCIDNDIELVFRPHPQAFLEWEATGEFTVPEQKKLRELFDSDERLHLDESSKYLAMFYSSDCLITDPSSVIYDYFLTTNPIIYSNGDDEASGMAMLQDGLYKAENWGDVEKYIKNLMSGKDVLKDIRKKLIKESYFINPKGSGNNIKIIIKDDAKK